MTNLIVGIAALVAAAGVIAFLAFVWVAIRDRARDRALRREVTRHLQRVRRGGAGALALALLLAVGCKAAARHGDTEIEIDTRGGSPATTSAPVSSLPESGGPAVSGGAPSEQRVGATAFALAGGDYEAARQLCILAARWLAQTGRAIAGVTNRAAAAEKELR